MREGVAIAALYGVFAGLILIFAGRTLSMLFVSADAADVLDASAKYLRCMGFFYWALGILGVCRMGAQGLGFSGRAVFSGVAEMIARTVVSLVFVKQYGFTAICFADQTAWVSACLYIVPTCILCVRKVVNNITPGTSS
jgi:Na+-driven multidrug efflux pump